MIPAPLACFFLLFDDDELAAAFCCCIETHCTFSLIPVGTMYIHNSIDNLLGVGRATMLSC